MFNIEESNSNLLFSAMFVGALVFVCLFLIIGGFAMMNKTEPTKCPEPTKLELKR